MTDTFIPTWRRQPLYCVWVRTGDHLGHSPAYGSILVSWFSISYSDPRKLRQFRKEPAEAGSLSERFRTAFHREASDDHRARLRR